MEFFRIVKIKTEKQIIQDKLTLDNLDLISSDIFVLEAQSKTESSIGGVWGEFTLTRHKIRGGLRFSLVECPNALTWTITTGFDPNPDAIILHLTINRQNHTEAFIEEIDAFLDDQVNSLEKIIF